MFRIWGLGMFRVEGLRFRFWEYVTLLHYITGHRNTSDPEPPSQAK